MALGPAIRIRTRSPSRSFPHPNQLGAPAAWKRRIRIFGPRQSASAPRRSRGTRAAVRTVIRYRNGVLEGRGASLLDGYMEDLATDRIYRLMIAQRIRYAGDYTPASISAMFDEELERILAELPDGTDDSSRARYRRAREISEAMIRSGTFDPT